MDPDYRELDLNDASMAQLENEEQSRLERHHLATDIGYTEWLTNLASGVNE